MWSCIRMCRNSQDLIKITIKKRKRTYNSIPKFTNHISPIDSFVKCASSWCQVRGEKKIPIKITCLDKDNWK